jgi:uroporphyrinogen-III synthase
MLDLSGRRVLVTLAREDSRLLVNRLESAGAEAVLFPCISVETLDGDFTRHHLGRALAQATWVAFSSRRGVEAVAQMGGKICQRTRIAAVGPGTEARAREHFGRCELVSSEGTGRSLGRDLARTIAEAGNMTESLAGAVVVIPRAESGRRDRELALIDVNIKTVSVPVYRTMVAKISDEILDLDSLGVDTVVLASPSATAGLLNQAHVPKNVKVVTIGPTTSQAVQEAGLTVSAEATEPSVDALLKALG